MANKPKKDQVQRGDHNLISYRVVSIVKLEAQNSICQISCEKENES